MTQVQSNSEDDLQATSSSNLPSNISAHQIVDEMRSSFIDYAMSVIIARALPDARDGLKPVHRRILYGMKQLNNTYNRPYVKCARVVGDVLGKYHPHGDASVYDALVRMAQDWNLRYPLVDGQGNFGSIEGDSAAAYRYTECRLRRISEFLLSDLEKDTVDFVPNFDDKEQEPTVLPTIVPNLLINGATGIAVGMATNIPPHNLGEVLDASIALAKNPDLTIADLMEYIPGPDFPTRGFIYGRKGIKQAYETGRGQIVLRARTEIEEIKKSDRTQIVVTEIPYQVNPNRILERLAELVREKKIEGISELRNESSREGMRLVIALKRDAIPQVVLNHLYNQTSLQVSFGIIMLAIVDGRPRVLNLRQALQEFLLHRREVVTRRTRYELGQAEARLEIVEGLGLAIENIDRIIELIRAAKDPEEAKEALLREPLPGLAEFLVRAGRPQVEIDERIHGNVSYLTEPQVKAILEMRLQRLTGLERDKLLAEFRELCELIAELKMILGDEKKLNDVIISELETLRKDFADKRGTEIIDQQSEISLEELIAEEPMVVTLSREGYIRRASLSEYRAQQRGGRGVIGAATKEEDLIRRVFCASTHDYVLLFTNRGRAYSKRIFELPEGSRTSRGKALVNVLQLQPEEKVVEMLPLPAFDPGKYVVMATRKGVIKKTELEAFSSIRSSGIIALSIDEGDSMIGARLTNGQMDLALCTSLGRVARFKEESVRPLSRQARGVRGIRLRAGDDVVALEVLDRDLPTTLLTISERGYGKRTKAADYPIKGRGSQGVITLKTNERNGKVVGVHVIYDTDDLMLVTSTGTVIRIRGRGIPVQSRNTQGVRLIRLTNSHRVVAAEVLGEFIGNGNAPSDELSANPEVKDATDEIEVINEPEEDLSDESDEDDEDVADGEAP